VSELKTWGFAGTAIEGAAGITTDATTLNVSAAERRSRKMLQGLIVIFEMLSSLGFIWELRWLELAPGAPAP